MPPQKYAHFPETLAFQLGYLWFMQQNWDVSAFLGEAWYDARVADELSRYDVSRERFDPIYQIAKRASCGRRERHLIVEHGIYHAKSNANSTSCIDRG
jgi:hypothetical protein